MNIHNVHFLKSVTHLDQRPLPLQPEVAVIGRSNVGKSSLINTLFNRKNLAKISSTPGKTRLINYFSVDDQLAHGGVDPTTLARAKAYYGR